MKPYQFSHLSDKFTFGNYNGCTLSEVIDMCPSYIEWCLQEIPYFLLHDEVMDEIHAIYPQYYCSQSFENKRKLNLDSYTNYIIHSSHQEFYDDDSNGDLDDEEPTYDRYNGSYAQDEMYRKERACGMLVAEMRIAGTKNLCNPMSRLTLIQL